MKTDIATHSDIMLLVDTFYQKVGVDPLLSPVFNDVAQVDWSLHLPIMYSFWSTLLIGPKTYRGQPFPKHLVLPINRAHFGRWLELFHETITEFFEGPVAEHAYYRANMIAQVFQSKLGLSGEPMFAMTE